MSARWGRVFAAVLLAPATLVVLNLLVNATLFIIIPGHLAQYVEGQLPATVFIAYLGSAVIGGLAAAVRAMLKVPLDVDVVVWLCALIAWGLGLLTPAEWSERLFLATLAAVATLPVSITYCLIAGVPATATSWPPPERRARALLAALLAPATLVGLEISLRDGYFQAAGGHAAKYFTGLFPLVLMAAYGGSAGVGVMASAMRRALKAPARAGVVISLFALCAAPFGLLIPIDAWAWRLCMAALAALASLPVSITYCLVAGVRWR